MKKQFVLLSFLLAALLCLGYWWWRRPTPLGPSDLLLIGDLDNQSGEPVFDHSLTLALRTALSQSPFLNLIAEQKVTNALKRIGKPEHEPITGTLAKAICGTLGAKAYLVGTVRKAGATYELDLQAYRCSDGARMAHTKSTAARDDLLIHSLGVAAADLRMQLGEGTDSVQRLNCPLERATTPIPAALQAYTEARQATNDSGDLEAVPHYKKAIELDSRFALARSGLAVSYYNLSQMELAGEEIRQAYEAGDRQTFRERLNITTLYYDLAQGDIDKAIEGYQRFIQAYPRDDVALGNLSSEYFVIGDYEQAAKYAEAALKVDPDSAAWYENYSTALMALSRTDEAERSLKEAFSRKLDDAALHSNLYSLGFMKGDNALMEQQLKWATDNHSGEDSLLASQSDTEAYFGRLTKARDYTARAVQAAQKADLMESAGTWEVEAALREALFGNSAEARKDAEESLKLAPASKDVQALAALVFARIGDDPKAQSIIDNLRAQYISNTAIQKAWLPVIRAQFAIRAKQNQEAIKILDPVTPYEKGQLTGNLSDSCMIPAYLRAEAYLGSQKSHEALTEFQKIQSFPGITGSCWSGTLSILGAARAAAQGGSIAEAKVDYQKFLELWKNADNDIFLLKAAKAEFAKLH
jgi:eukaryotic-like serine/threonine-protein kinase